MRWVAASALAIAMLTAQPTRAEDEKIPLDLRFPVRFGFAFANIGHARASAMSFSWGIDVDVAHITKRLAFELVGDLDGTFRPDLPDADLRSGFASAALGAGLFYVTPGDVALGVESTISMTFDNQNLVGGGFATRLVLIPFYMTFEQAARSRVDRMAAWVRSAISIWAMARMDLTSDGNGATLAFGGAFDLMRVFFLPYLTVLTGNKR